MIAVFIKELYVVTQEKKNSQEKTKVEDCAMQL